MKEEISECMFSLTKPFEYAFKGKQREASFISLTAPTMLQHSQAAALKQSISRMIVGVAEEVDEDLEDKEDDKGGDGITAKMLVGTIYTSKCVDANVVWEQAKALFKQGVALIDGEQKLTAPLIDKMDPEDFENLVGEYVANFILV